jgi:hypothetical protein
MAEPTTRIIHGDALAMLKTLPDESVQTCVTSPPYFGLRDYGIDGQIGLEETPQLFVRSLVEVFREVRRVLREDGTAWLNLGDSYAGLGSGRWGGGNIPATENYKPKDQRTFNTEGWLTPNSYSNNFASLPKRPGIYVLVRATWYPTISHRVLYVGMSTNIAKRLDGHEIKAMCDKEDGKNDYVQVYFKTCPPEALRARERRLIKRFNPPFNLQHRVRGI